MLKFPKIKLPALKLPATRVPEIKPTTINVSSAVAAVRDKRLQTQVRSAIGVDVGARAVKAVQFGRERWGEGRWAVVAAAEVPRSDVSNSSARAAGAASGQVLTADEV